MWLVTKIVIMAFLVLSILLNVSTETRRKAWWAPAMGVVACALPSSGMPVAGGIVFLPMLTRIGGLPARDAVAFAAATQTVGVGILAPLNWLFHDRRVFVRNGRGDIFLLTTLPSFGGVALTKLINVPDEVTMWAFTAFVAVVAIYTFWFASKSGFNQGNKTPNHNEIKLFTRGPICMITLLSFFGGISVGIIGIGIEKLLFVYLTWIYDIDSRSAGITSIISVGIASGFSFTWHAWAQEVPYDWWLMVLPGILLGKSRSCI